jgi:phospho-N-acetylmuramoyl-pentapeptide-transferase
MNTLEKPISLVLQLAPIDLMKIFLPIFVSFTFGMIAIPFILRLMKRFDLRKKKNVQKSIDGRPATFAAKIDNDEGKVLYRMGALVVFAGVFAAMALFRLLPVLIPNESLASLNFLSRSQTWLPVAALIVGATVGAFDDLIVAGRFRRFSRYVGDGLSLQVRLGFALIIGIVCAWWVTSKQDITSLYVPFVGTFMIGWFWLSLVVVAAIVVTYAGSVIDGVDGLSGGVFSLMYAAMGVICFLQARNDLAALCFAIVGGLLAFLWFNIPPARYMLSDVGSMPLTIVLAIISVLTGSVMVLPIITAPLVWSIGSVVLQLTSKKLRHGKKIFHASPYHLHLQVNGWEKHQVSMRYWIVAALCSGLGLVLFVAGGYFTS